jgi:hypothetical protein
MQMVTSMMATGKMIRHTASEFTLILMVLVMRAIGKRINNMVKA